MDKVTVNGVDYFKAQNCGSLNIVILQRGWIMVGYLERDGQDCKLTQASVIRKWGTTQGLGQIAQDGPASETVLDPCHGVVQFHWLTVIATIACDESKWEKFLK